MTYAIDFDGVIYKNEKIDEKIVERINELRQAGNRVVLFTSRKGKAFENAKTMFEGVEFDDMISGKFYADAYVDDKNITIDEFMEEEKRMSIKKGREYRSFKLEKREQVEGTEKDYKVRGYASTFEPYVLFTWDGVDYIEQIDKRAFDEADLSDVIFLYNHEGMVYARQKNGTLKVTTDDHGLLTEADLSSTTQSRELFEAIDSGLVDQMSFAFTVTEESYNKDTHTRTILKIGKVYDVSAVSIPANPTTDISVDSRDWCNGVIAAEQAERLEREKALELAKAKFNYLEV